MRYGLLVFALVIALAGATGAFAPSAGADDLGDPGLTLTLSNETSLVDGTYVVMTATATCDASYNTPAFQYAELYLWVIQETNAGTAAGEGDAPMYCDGLPHTVSTEVYPEDVNVPFHAGPALLSGAGDVYTYSDAQGFQVYWTGSVAGTTNIHGAPPVRAAPTGELGLSLGRSTLGSDGSLTLTVKATCASGSVYDGDLIGFEGPLYEKTAGGIAAGYAWPNFVPLVCDGRSHQYPAAIGASTYPWDAPVPLKPGLAVVQPWFHVIAPDGSPVADEFSSSTTVVVQR